MKMQNKDYIQANRQMWNKTAHAHGQGYVKSLKQKIAEPAYSSLSSIEKDIFFGMDVQGKSVAQLCCNNGQELISVKRLGAGECVGFDISDGAIEQAKELAGLANTELNFVQTDVYLIDPVYKEQFDIVYITVGALGWLPDIEKFFQIAANLLKQDGQIFIYEMHPVLDMYEPLSDSGVTESYFNRGPFKDEGSVDYMDKTTFVEGDSYWFHHTLSDIFTAIIEAGMSLRHFKEYPHDISMVYKKTADSKNPPPMSYTLIAQKRN